MKPVDLISSSIRPTLINTYLIEQIEVDLTHINYGLDSKKGYGSEARSNYILRDIVQFFESLYGIEVNSESDGNWEYFVINKPFFGKKKIHRMVFCIEQNEPSTCGIITFYEIKKRGSL